MAAPLIRYPLPANDPIDEAVEICDRLLAGCDRLARLAAAGIEVCRKNRAQWHDWKVGDMALRERRPYKPPVYVSSVEPLRWRPSPEHRNVYPAEQGELLPIPDGYVPPPDTDALPPTERCAVTLDWLDAHDAVLTRTFGTEAMAEARTHLRRWREIHARIDALPTLSDPPSREEALARAEAMLDIVAELRS
ncbi:MAG TPA: hypothetical protein VFA12_20575 [Stellaceae bacterium]|nr:hypothetical protein [Stellaceae bacterium]